MPNIKTNLSLAGTKGDAAPVAPSNLWEVLDREYEGNYKIPDNCFDTSEVSKRYGKTYSEAQGIIERMLRKGTIEFIGKFGPRNSKYYRLKA